jgi:hypothetical protein
MDEMLRVIQRAPKVGLLGDEMYLINRGDPQAESEAKSCLLFINLAKALNIGKLYLEQRQLLDLRFSI